MATKRERARERIANILKFDALNFLSNERSWSFEDELDDYERGKIDKQTLEVNCLVFDALQFFTKSAEGKKVVSDIVSEHGNVVDEIKKRLNDNSSYVFNKFTGLFSKVQNVSNSSVAVLRTFLSSGDFDETKPDFDYSSVIAGLKNILCIIKGDFDRKINIHEVEFGIESYLNAIKCMGINIEERITECIKKCENKQKNVLAQQELAPLKTLPSLNIREFDPLPKHNPYPYIDYSKKTPPREIIYRSSPVNKDNLRSFSYKEFMGIAAVSLRCDGLQFVPEKIDRKHNDNDNQHVHWDIEKDEFRYKKYVGGAFLNVKYWLYNFLNGEITEQDFAVNSSVFSILPFFTEDKDGIEIASNIKSKHGIDIVNNVKECLKNNSFHVLNGFTRGLSYIESVDNSSVAVLRTFLSSGDFDETKPDFDYNSVIAGLKNILYIIKGEKKLDNSISGHIEPYIRAVKCMDINIEDYVTECIKKCENKQKEAARQGLSSSTITPPKSQVNAKSLSPLTLPQEDKPQGEPQIRRCVSLPSLLNLKEEQYSDSSVLQQQSPLREQTRIPTRRKIQTSRRKKLQGYKPQGKPQIRRCVSLPSLLNLKEEQYSGLSVLQRRPSSSREQTRIPLRKKYKDREFLLYLGKKYAKKYASLSRLNSIKPIKWKGKNDKSGQKTSKSARTPESSRQRII
ncbi:MAG: hypothetical protein LBC92_03005 [Rickettsiales bacterium]|jgi:hypothetical protein|nr:hypothetical protein [Rickettsiales bacterium]